MSASAVDPWRLAPPLELVRHECSHFLAARYFDPSATATISHDGVSWRTDIHWSAKPVDERAVVGSWLGGTAVRAYMSGVDHLICNAIPRELKFEILSELQPTFEMVAGIKESKLQELATAMARDGSVLIE